MNRKSNEIITKFIEAVPEFLAFCNMARAREYQLQTIKKLETIRETTTEIKKEAINYQEEDSANAMLSLEFIIEAIINELKMWIALKDDEPNSAWDYLIKAEFDMQTAMRAHRIAIQFNKYSYNEHLYALELHLFPRLKFLSTCMIIEMSKCSICGQEYGECNHIKGKPYMGQMCNRIITKTKESKEVSIVDEPADKRCRFFTTIDKDVKRDVMSWRIIKESSDEMGNNLGCEEQNIIEGRIIFADGRN